MLATELARTDGLLYRRGTFAGTLDDLICDALLVRARRRDRALARLPLGRHADRRRSRHLGGRLQRHRHHLSGRLSHGHDGRRPSRPILEDVADNSVQPRSLLPAGRRHGARRRHGLHHRRRRRDGQPHRQHAPPGLRRADRGRARTTSWPAGARSTRTPRARRSGTSSPPISRAASCSRRSRANRSRSCAPAAERPAAPLYWRRSEHPT